MNKMLNRFSFRSIQRTISVIRLPAYRNKSSNVNHPLSSRKKLVSNDIISDADTFGNYSETVSKLDVMKDDPEDIKERMRQRQMDRRTPAFYIDSIKSHLNNHNFEKALDVLENRMLTIDKVKPDSYVYDLLISYCGRTGNVKEAFRLYNQIKKRGYHVTGGQYTSLFNACANARNSTLALEIAHKVRKYLSEDELHKANIKNYNSMLKAFGRHGDLKAALELMDEVLEKRRRVRDDTYNFLLQACISDTNTGFRHALLVWHRLLQNKTDPTTITFNLMLRATRDCGFGAPEQIQTTIENILSEGKTRSLRTLTLKDAAPILLPNCDHQEHPDSFSTDDQLQTDSNLESSYPASLRDEQKIVLPNLLAILPQMGSVIQLASFTTAYHRLMLLGGAVGFLQTMDRVNVKPDVKTFTLLLEIIPSTEEAENDLIEIMKIKNAPFDAGFFNVLIKKRSFRNDYTKAKNVLTLMQSHGIQADLITFGVLALTCRTREDGENLIASVRDAGYRVNSEILGSLVRQAIYQGDIQYVRSVLSAMKEDSVQPSPKLMILLDQFMKQQKKIIGI